ncbi:MAG TPA: ABC transporter substrate-binding protein [Burkholderiales bacterium]|nr:ABC transporter substrate-binding protein [Burkholderiales bacterium]
MALANSCWGRCFAALIVAAAIAAPAGAAERAKPYRIGVLNEAWAANHPTVDGLRAGLREIGLVEGRDVSLDIRFTHGNPKALAPAAEALVKVGVDLVFTSGEAATLAAKRAAPNLPIVFTLIGDPVTAGIVEQMPRPGGNLTGISSLSTDLVPKRLELLKTLFPAVRRVVFIYDATDPAGAAELTMGLLGAAKLGIEIFAVGVADAPHVTAVLGTLKRGDALLAPDQGGFDIGAAILEKSLAARVPAVFSSSLWIENGGLASYGSEYYAQGVQAARLVAKILRGARPGDLPVEGADRIEIAVNLKTASNLGLAVPRKILLRADKVLR